MSALKHPEHGILNLNQIYCTHVLLSQLSLPVYNISSVHIPKVCVDGSPVVCLFPEIRINKGQPSHQTTNPQGSRIYKYLICPAESDCLHCWLQINWSHRFRMCGVKCSPHVTHLPIDHINVWIVSVTILNGCVYCFFISVKKMRKKSHEPPRLYKWSVTRICLTCRNIG